MQLRYLKVLVLAAIIAGSVLTAAAPLGAAEQNSYKVTNLVSNTAAMVCCMMLSLPMAGEVSPVPACRPGLTPSPGSPAGEHNYRV